MAERLAELAGTHQLALIKLDSYYVEHPDADVVAAYGDDDRARLLADAGIVRTRLKVAAAISNASIGTA